MAIAAHPILGYPVYHDLHEESTVCRLETGKQQKLRTFHSPPLPEGRRSGQRLRKGVSGGGDCAKPNADAFPARIASSLASCPPPAGLRSFPSHGRRWPFHRKAAFACHPSDDVTSLRGQFLHLRHDVDPRRSVRERRERASQS